MIQKIKKIYLQKRLFSTINSILKPYYFGIFHLFYNPGRSIKIHSPEFKVPVTNDPYEDEIVNRIFRSFKKMKEDQQTCDKVFYPSSIWQSQLDISYSYLNDGLKNNDLEKFHYLLTNFGSWPDYTGITHATFIKRYSKNIIGRRYLQNRFYKNLLIWQWFNERKNINSLTYPQHGNQSGAYIGDTFIGFGSFFNEIYGSLLSKLIINYKLPIIAEIGAGCGIWSHFILRNLDRFCYLDFDLPETLCLAAYYLMKEYPEKKTLLYGETEYSPDCHKNYDLIFLPNYEIGKIYKTNIDLFLNKNSLGEMHKDVVKKYLNVITSCAKYFFHMNHEKWVHTYDDGSSGLLASDYNIPKKKYKLLMRYPDLAHLTYEGGINYNHDIFFYLYEKIQLEE